MTIFFRLSRLRTTVAEEKIAIQKMLKMSIPRAAVQHKMQRDEVSQKITDAVLGEVSRKTEYCLTPINKDHTVASKTKSSLTDDEESVASNYRKMLKLRFPKIKCCIE
jgi:hypothetical protein